MKRRHFLSAAGVGAAASASAPSLLPALTGPLHLKITGLKTFVVNVGMSNWVF